MSVPGGLGNISSASMSLAVQRVLAQLYSGMSEVDEPVNDVIPGNCSTISGW